MKKRKEAKVRKVVVQTYDEDGELFETFEGMGIYGLLANEKDCTTLGLGGLNPIQTYTIVCRLRELSSRLESAIPPVILDMIHSLHIGEADPAPEGNDLAPEDGKPALD